MKIKWILLAPLVGLFRIAHGGSGAWIGSGAWDSTPNWNVFSGVGFPNSFTDDAVFSGPGVTTVTSGIPITVRSIQLLNTGVSYTITLSGNTLTTPLVGANSAYTGNATISAPISLPSNFTFDSAAPGNVTLSGVISGGFGVTRSSTVGTGTLSLTNTNTYTGGTTINAGSITVSADANMGNAAGGLTFNTGTLITTASFSSSRAVTLQSGGGTVQTGGGVTTTFAGLVSGTGALTKTGTGILALTNASNSYSGGNNINAGTVSISNEHQLGTNAASIAINSGTLLFTGTTTFPAGRAFSVGTATIDTGSFTVEIDAGITGVSGSLTKAGTGTLNLGGVCTYGGGTTINAGTLALLSGGGISTTGDVTVNNSGSVFDISAASSGDVTIGNLTGTNLTSLNAGIVLFIFGTSTGGPYTFGGAISGSGEIRKQGTSTAVFTGNSAYTGTVTINAGTLSLSSSGNLTNAKINVNSSSSTFDISGASTSKSVADMLGVAGGTVNLGAKNLIIDSATVSAVCNSTIIGTGGSITKKGTGTTSFFATNTYTGGTSIDNGALTIAADANLGTGGTLTLNGGTLNSASAFPTTITRAVSVTAANGTINVPTANTTMNGPITGTGSLTKNGSAALILTNAGNTYSGGSIISNGTLAISGSGTLAAAGGVNVNSATSIFDISAITAGGLTIGALNGAASSSVVLGAKALTLGSTPTATFAGVISGTGGSVVKQQSGIAIFTAANTYTGGTTINAGTLSLSGSGSLLSTGAVTMTGTATFNISATTSGTTIGNLTGAAGNVITLANKTLTFGAAGNTTYAGNINGNTGGSIVKAGAGTITLSGAGDYSGGTTISAGTLSISADGNLGGAAGGITLSGGTLRTTASFSSSRAVSLTTGSSIETAGAGITTTLNGSLTGTGPLTKIGPDNLTLTSASNSYTGGTLINDGTLALSGSGVLLSTGAVSLNSFTSTFDISGTSTGATIGDLTGVNSSFIVLGTKTLTFGTATVTSEFGGVFDATAGSIIKQGSGEAVLTGTSYSTGSVTINNGTLSLAGDGTIASASGVSVNSASSIFKISGTNGGATIGDLTGVANSSVVLGAKIFTFGTATATSTFDGVISGNGGSIVKQGSGTAIFTAANTYTGGTTINAGTLSLSGSGSLFSTGAVTMSGTATFDISATTAGTTIGNLTGAVGNVITLASKTLTFNAAGNTTYAGNINGNTGGSIVKAGAGTITLSGAGDYSGGTTISAGTLSISADGNLGGAAGGITLSGGTLQTTASFASSRAVSLTTGSSIETVGAGITTTLNGSLTGTGPLTKIGAGNLTLTSASNSYTGGTTINAGTLALSGSGVLLSTGAVTLSSSGTFDINAITPAGTTIGDLTGVTGSVITLGSKALTFGTAGTATYAGNINGTGSIIKAGAGTAVLSGGGNYSGGTTINAGTLSISANANLGGASGGVTLSGGTLQTTASFSSSRAVSLTTGSSIETVGAGITTTFSGSVTGTGPLTKIGAGKLTLTSATNSYTGGTLINAGTLALSGSGVLLSTGAVTLSSTGTFDISGTIAGSTIGDLTGVSGSIITLGSKALTFGTASNTAYGGNINGNIGGSIVKAGAGTVTLSGAGDYSGGTTISAGTLSISADGNLGGAAGGITLSGGTLQTTASFASSRAVSLTTGSSIETVGAGITTTLNGSLTGSGPLTKIGAGNLTLTSASNSYTAGTLINAGTLALSGSGVLLSTGAVTLSGTATFDISGISAGGTTIGDLTGAVGNVITLASKALTFGAAGNTTYAGNINGNTGGSIVKAGAGTATLSGAGDYSGGTTISAGTLSISADGNLGGAAGGIILSGGTLQTTASFASSRAVSLTTGSSIETVGAGVTTTLDGSLTGTGPLTKIGAGNLTLTSASNSYTGGTTINAGTLALSGSGVLLSTGAVSVNSSSSIFDISATSGSTIGDLTGVTGSSVTLGNNALTLGTSTPGPVTFAGVISDTGTGSIVKQGSGTAAFTGANTYAGGTTINAGTLSIIANNNLGNTSGSLTFGGGTLQTTTNSFSMGRAISLSTAGTFETVGVTTTLTGAITGGALNKTGTGTLSLANGTNSYTGTTTITGGTLAYSTDGAIAAGNSVAVGNGINPSTFSIEATMTTPNALNVTINAASTMVGTSGTAMQLAFIQGAGALDLGIGTRDININPTSADAFAGTITGGVPSASSDPTTGNRLTKAGTQTLTLSNAASDFVSRLFIANGVLEAQNGLALGAGGANSAAYVQGSATLEIDGSINLQKTLLLNGTGFGGNGALRSLSGTNTVSQGITIGWAGGPESAADATIQVDAGSLSATGVISGSNNLTKIGTGSLTFGGSAANTLSGTTTVNAGTLFLNKPAGVNAINGPLTINATGTAQLSAANQIVDTAVVSLSGGTFNMNANAETVGQLLFTSGTLTQAGALLTLNSGLNTALTMTGNTIAGPIAFNGTSGMTIGSGATISGSVTFNGAGDVVYSGGATSTISGGVNLGSFAHTFNVPVGTGSDLIVSGAISGTGSITKSTGVGTLTFNGSSANTYSGLTTVNAGTLLLNKTVANGAITGNATLNAGGTLLLGAADQISNSSVVTLSGGTWNMASFNETVGQLIFSSGTLTQGTGILTLSSGLNTALTMSDGTSISGNLAFTSTGGITYSGATSATVSGPVNLASFAHTIDVSAAADLIVSGVVSGTGSLNKVSGGLLSILGGSGNTYTGDTTVGAGTLLMNKTSGNALPGNVIVSGGILNSGNSDQIANSSVVTLSGGTWNLSTFTETVSELLFTAGTFTQGIGGVLTVSNGLDSAVTMTNSTSIAGDVVFAGASGLTMGDGTTISGNLTFQGAGGVNYNGSSSTATLTGGVDLGGFAHNFTIGSGAAPGMTVSGVLSGAASTVTKLGSGELQFSGASPNTYTGLTIVTAGTLLLNKTAGVNAIAGNALINGGALTLNAANQIINTATMTITSGSFNMGANNEQIDNLVISGGSVTQAGSTLTLSPAGSVALAVGDTSTISGGTLSLPGTSQIVFNGSAGTGTVSSNLNLNAAAHTFNIATSSAGIAMDLQGVISNGTVTKTGSGELRFSGSSANTYTGLTTISDGTLLLQKTGANAIAADLLINPSATLALGAASQIVDTATVTLGGGLMSMNGFAETINTLLFTSGTLSQGGATLSLVNVSMSDNTLIAGPLAFTAAGGLTYNGSSTSATISGDVNLGSFAQAFNIANGSDSIDQTISGVISNGSLNKTGAGTLLLTGANTYGGGTTVTAGVLQGDTTSLQGNILNNASLVFDQAGAGTYAGSISGTGVLTKMGAGSVELTGANTTGAVTVSAGLLSVNGSLAGGSTMTVAPGASVGGTGTITKDITFDGTLAPGNSIGTIHLVGAQTFASGFNLEIEMDPVASDQVDITGTLSIQPGASLTIIPDPGAYPDTFTYTLVQTTGGITGTFTSVINTHPVFTANIVYTGLDILLQAGFRPFNELVTTGNAAQVANCLSGFTPSPDSDLAFIINQLRAAPTQTQLADALNLMQPSQFTALALMQENNTLYLNEGLFNHLESLSPRCEIENMDLSPINLWSVPFIAHQTQNHHGITQGYSATTPGVLLGLDGRIAEDLVLGFAVGYSYSHLKWTQQAGRAKEQAGYGALYGRWAKKHGYLETSLIYGYSRYKTDRLINFTIDIPVDRDAEGRHHGMQGSGHLKAALDWNYKNATFEPFADIAYIYVHESPFMEKGAQSLNLDVQSKNSNLLMSEGGLRFSYCRLVHTNAMLTPYAQASFIYESRWLGKHEKALFNGCPLNVTGLNPSRGLLGLEAGINFALDDQAVTFSLFYKGRFGQRFADNSGYVQFNVKL